MQLEIGTETGDYRIVREIGRPGSGRVYEVVHRITGRAEAMKILAGGERNDDQSQRFQQAIQAQARLNQPNICAVYNAFWLADSLAVVRELVPGESLESILARGELSLPVGLGYVRQALDGLGYAHLAGVVHGDVKPSNLLLTEAGVLKLADFGLAQAKGDTLPAGSEAFTGTLQYASPEQLAGQPMDAKSDLYSLGAILYHIATGRPPFPGNQADDLIKAHAALLPVPPSSLNPAIPRDLETTILRSLNKDPGQRFSTAGEFRAALDRQNLTQAAGQHWPRRAVLIATTGAVVSAIVYLRRPDSESNRAAVPALPPPYAEPSAGLQLLRRLDVGAIAQAVALSGDGATIAALAGKEIHIWDTATGQQKGSVEAEGPPALALDQVGALLASGSGVWLTLISTSGDTRMRLAAGGDVRSAAFQPNGGVVAAGVRTGEVRWWDTTTGNALGAWIGEGKSVEAIAFSLTGRRLAAVSGSTVSIINPETRVVLEHLQAAARIVAIAPASGDGWVTLQASGQGLNVVQLGGSPPLGHVSQNRPPQGTIIRNGDRLATALDHEIWLFGRNSPLGSAAPLKPLTKSDPPPKPRMPWYRRWPARLFRRNRE